jgi:hypothetical protein
MEMAGSRGGSENEAGEISLPLTESSPYLVAPFFSENPNPPISSIRPLPN